MVDMVQILFKGGPCDGIYKNVPNLNHDVAIINGARYELVVDKGVNYFKYVGMKEKPVIKNHIGSIDIEKRIIPEGFELVRITTTVKRNETFIGEGLKLITWTQTDEFKMSNPVLVVSKKILGKGNCETCGKWDSSLDEGMCSCCRKKYL